MSGQKLFSGNDFEQETWYENGGRGRGSRGYVHEGRGGDGGGGVRLRGDHSRGKEWNNGGKGDGDEVSSKRVEDRVRAKVRMDRVKSYDKDRRRSVSGK